LSIARRQLGCRVCALVALLAAFGAASAHAAGDRAAGRKKAVECQTCHGLDGLSKIPEAPKLAGQNEQYLVKALGDYKSGARQNDMMSIVAPNLSDADIANLAAYYSGIEAAAAPSK
jgi:cytochrome c553